MIEVRIGQTRTFESLDGSMLITGTIINIEEGQWVLETKAGNKYLAKRLFKIKR